MTDQGNPDLKYGHLGSSIYSTENRTWVWRRSLGIAYALQRLGKPTLVLQLESRAHSAPEEQHGDAQAPSLSRTEKAQDLVDREPEVKPASGILRQLANTSSKAIKAALAYDPAIGTLLDYGKVRNEVLQRFLSVVAFPASESRSALCLGEVHMQRHGWENDKSVWIEVPRISGDLVRWDLGSPLQQVCFASTSEGKGSFLAARTMASTIILRPYVHRRRTVGGWPTASPYLDPHPICTISQVDSGGFPHADVAFNPWYQRQFALIDQAGSWTVWDLSQGEQRRRGEPHREVCRGLLRDDDEVELGKGRTALMHDGWARIIWCGDLTTIATCSRRNLAVFDIKGNAYRLNVPDLGIAGSSHWILDMIRHPSQPNQMYILTSMHLFLLKVTCLDRADTESWRTAGAVVILRCAHFLDPEDISLRLKDFKDNEETVVTIRSSLSPTAISFRFRSDETISPAFSAVSDAMTVKLPSFPGEPGTDGLITSIDVQPVECINNSHHSEAAGLGHQYQSNRFRWYNMTVLLRDMRIYQQTYFGGPKSHGDAFYSQVVLPPHWRSKIKQSAQGTREGSFVVPDDASDGEDGGPEDERRAMAPRMHARANGNGSFRDTWTLSYEAAYKALTESNLGAADDFSTLVQNFRQHLEAANADEGLQPLQLLTELCNHQPRISDLDQASSDFEELLQHSGSGQLDLQSQQHDARYEIMRLSNTDMLGLTKQPDEHMSLVFVYDDIVRSWLGPVSVRVAGRVRLAKEQLARRIAADLCIASHGIGRAIPASQQIGSQAMDEDQEIQQDGPTGEGALDPSRSRRTSLGVESLSRMTDSMALSQPQTALPTPSATPSLTTSTSLSSHPTTLQAPEFARLQRYTTFSANKTAPGPLPKALGNKLSHWELGGDPDKYDWLTTQRQQDRDAEFEDEDLTPAERARIKRRAERHLRRQRRETAAAQAMGVMSSQAPEVFSASQPMGGGSTVGRMNLGGSQQVGRPSMGRSQPFVLTSSQPSQSQMFPASQVEPGRFGGRPAKKRRRTEGF
ncbi:hypothetical protein M8818_006961 [Zalaria obscura]|uniref:Uncharacterized protein n=1 Tax=Zalaria obscura TaxID=2024903 RepID=A0ACC3S5Z3_9PEZI